MVRGGGRKPIHVFVGQLFIEHVLYVKHCARHLNHSLVKKTETIPGVSSCGNLIQGIGYTGGGRVERSN